MTLSSLARNKIQAMEKAWTDINNGVIGERQFEAKLTEFIGEFKNMSVANHALKETVKKQKKKIEELEVETEKQKKKMEEMTKQKKPAKKTKIKKVGTVRSFFVVEFKAALVAAGNPAKGKEVNKAVAAEWKNIKSTDGGTKKYEDMRKEAQIRYMAAMAASGQPPNPVFKKISYYLRYSKVEKERLKGLGKSSVEIKDACKTGWAEFKSKFMHKVGSKWLFNADMTDDFALAVRAFCDKENETRRLAAIAALAEPVAEPAVVVEPVVVEPVAEPVAEPVVVEPVVAEPVAEPVVEPVAEPVEVGAFEAEIAAEMAEEFDEDAEAEMAANLEIMHEMEIEAERKESESESESESDSDSDSDSESESESEYEKKAKPSLRKRRVDGRIENDVAIFAEDGSTNGESDDVIENFSGFKTFDFTELESFDMPIKKMSKKRVQEELSALGCQTTGKLKELREMLLYATGLDQPFAYDEEKEKHDESGMLKVDYRINSDYVSRAAVCDVFRRVGTRVRNSFEMIEIIRSRMQVPRSILRDPEKLTFMHSWMEYKHRKNMEKRAAKYAAGKRKSK